MNYKLKQILETVKLKRNNITLYPSAQQNSTDMPAAENSNIHLQLFALVKLIILPYVGLSYKITFCKQ